MSHLINKLGWFALAAAGAFAFAFIALHLGESIGAIWIVVATVCVYTIAYRFYSQFIARRVLRLNAARMTPAYKFNDGLDYVPTNKYVLFGHHFAAIAGAGPLVGPILAAQMGYMPGMLWLLAGVVFAGAVQDFIVLFVSTRRDGRSLGDLIKSELGQIPGMIALFGTFFIMLILLAVLALIVVKALAESPWGAFTVAATIPIALFMGVYARFIRPGAIGEVSMIGFVLLMLSIVAGQYVQEVPALAALLTLTGEQLTWMLIAYGFIASVLPVWLLLAPRDYLSTFLKIGTIVGLAIGVIFISPELKMPAFTQFVDGSGPVWSGSLFPFLFITIACGAVSGFHSLISSGTTPKMIRNELDARFIGYGAMLMESFVAIMALVAASTLEPGVYFAMNSPTAIIGSTAESAARAISQWGFYVTPEMITQTARDVGEHTIISRTGGAPTLAVGMAQILSDVVGGRSMMAFWYHFAILFEALFILTAVDAGTRAGRFMLQDLLGTFIPSMKRTDSMVASLIATGICVAGWGYFLYQGVIDPLGGINTLWPLFGISNQMLAAIALCVGTTILIKSGKLRYAWVTGLPLAWLIVITTSAAWAKLFSPDIAIGFLAQAEHLSRGLTAGTLTADVAEHAPQLIFNSRLNAGMTVFFLITTWVLLLETLRVCYRKISGYSQRPSSEAPYVHTQLPDSV
ncbi:MAG: carbon starvation protein A [Nitrosospira sp.]|nr:carbon starvation protein A [Nitrosospira sp.]